MDALTPDRALVARFSTDLDALAGAGPLGLAVSGGGDSIALLLLAAAARPGGVEALSVDHGLRPEASDEVQAVAALCRRLKVPVHTLKLDLARGGNVQARARDARYTAMAEVVSQRGLTALATAHHADDQAETLLMRLDRGSGVSGLAGVRARQAIGGMSVIRPLLGWRKAELRAICDAAGVRAADDPSNADPRFDRASIRAAMAGLALDPAKLARSATYLALADEALEWAAEAHADRLRIDGREAHLDGEDLPTEIVRRLFLRAFALLNAPAPRGPDLERVIARSVDDGASTLSGLLVQPLGAASWRLSPEPPRRG